MFNRLSNSFENIARDVASDRLGIGTELGADRPFVVGHKPTFSHFAPPAAHPLRRTAFLLRRVAR